MFSPARCPHSRIDRRLRPTLESGSQRFVALEPRVLLSATAEPASGAVHLAAQDRNLARLELHHKRAANPHKRLTPAQEINAQYATFTAGFAKVLNDYVQSIDEQSTNMVTVSATITATYAPPSSVIQVDDAAVFGPEGPFTPPIVAQAVFGTVSLGSVTLNGSSGNELIVNPASPPTVTLPVNTVLTASIFSNAQTSAATIFPTYVIDSTIEMAINLVKYFNSLPIKLPAENTPPHTPVQRGAIQGYVYDSIAAVSTSSLYQYTDGTVPPSLQQLLLQIPLPTTPGSDLEIYKEAVMSAIAESHQQLNDGITQIFNRSLLVTPSRRQTGSARTSTPAAADHRAQAPQPAPPAALPQRPGRRRLPLADAVRADGTSQSPHSLAVELVRKLPSLPKRDGRNNP